MGSRTKYSRAISVISITLFLLFQNCSMDTTYISSQQFSSQLNDSVGLNTIIYNVSSSNFTKRVLKFSDTNDVSEPRNLESKILKFIGVRALVYSWLRVHPVSCNMFPVLEACDDVCHSMT